MNKKNAIKLFQDKKIRVKWDDEKEEYYFSIIDVIAVLTESDRSRKYWNDLKSKLEQEGSEVYDKIVRLKMVAEDGKKRNTDCFSTEDLLRVIQTIPSLKAEPFKLWLVEMGKERLDETADPE